MKNQGRVDYNNTSADNQEDEIRSLLQGRSKPARSKTKTVLCVVGGIVGLFAIAAQFADGGNSDLQVTAGAEHLQQEHSKIGYHQYRRKTDRDSTGFDQRTSRL